MRWAQSPDTDCEPDPSPLRGGGVASVTHTVTGSRLAVSRLPAYRGDVALFAHQALAFGANVACGVDADHTFTIVAARSVVLSSS